MSAVNVPTPGRVKAPPQGDSHTCDQQGRALSTWMPPFGGPQKCHRLRHVTARGHLPCKATGLSTAAAPHSPAGEDAKQARGRPCVAGGAGVAPTAAGDGGPQALCEDQNGRQPLTCSRHDGVDREAPAPAVHRPVADELPLELVPRDAQLAGPVGPLSACGAQHAGVGPLYAPTRTSSDVVTHAESKQPGQLSLT